MNWQNIANIATALGLPLLLITLLLEMRRSANERARQTQLDLSQRYGDFLRMAMDQPQLQLADFLKASEISVPLSNSELQYKKILAMEILVSLFEDAHFLLNHSWNPLRRQSWSGWEQYIAYWMNRPDFRRAWHEHFNAQYNGDFMYYMKRRWPDSSVNIRAQDEGSTLV